MGLSLSCPPDAEPHRRNRTIDTDGRALDPDKLQQLALRVWGYKQGEVVA